MVVQSIKKEVIFISLLAFLSLFFIYVYESALSSEKKIYEHIQEDKINEYKYFFDNFTNHLISTYKITTKEDFYKLLANPEKRMVCQKSLELFTSKEVKYIYILQKDKDQKFRFLLDASKQDKANFYQKFDVKDNAYQKIYTTHKAQIIYQKNIQNLYLTYLYPIILHHSVVAIISVDISIKFKHDIANIMSSFKIFFKFLIILIFLLIVVIIFYIFYYYFSRKKLFLDPLTKIFNRNYLEEISSLLRLENYAIAMLDLDKFKTINDIYGHKCGDYVLAKSAKIITESLRNDDIVIRFGGEEFLILLHVRGDARSAISMCERIRKNIENTTFIFDEQEIYVRISIGLNTHPVEAKYLDEAIKLADKKLYIAKRNGRNQVVSSLKNNMNILNEDKQQKDISYVKQALLQKNVVCYFQPIYDVKIKKIIKHEALVRIIDNDGTIISPVYFLPNIAHTNIHFKLTKEIFRICFETAKEQNQPISININYSDLINKDIENMIIDNLKNNYELASKITFEILESDEIDNIELFIEKIKTLHTLGCTISIDDFGSGYSNFKTVLDMEADYLKIDGTLIKNIDKDEKSYKVVKNIIQFAKDAQMKTIAEFVHSKEVYDKLVLLDVDFLQGYYISEPKATLQTEVDNKISHPKD